MNRLPFERFSVLLLSLLLVGPAFGQNADQQAAEQINPPDDLEIPPAPVLSPQEALASFQIEEGFEIQLVASEPLIEDPVCMAWDPDGRLWVCEMKGYMPTIEAEGEQEPVGNIVILEDTDGDGVMDQRTVFMDEIVLPRALAFAGGGVLYADSTTLYYVRINANGTPGPRQPIDRAYSNNGGNASNVEHQANGLLFGLDNWYYNAKSNRRYQQLGRRFMPGTTEFRGQWGITQDDDGNLLANRNPVLIEYDLFPPSSTTRNPNFNFNSAGQQGTLRVNNSVYPIRVTPGINRGYRPNTVSHETWKLLVATAACGPVIYRGDQFPDEYYNSVFVPEPAGHLLKRIILEENEEGMPTARQAYEEREFLASTDERCRFVNSYVGPDGCLYLVDMYRGLIQHRTYITPYLRRQIAARNLDTPIGLGRIYRVVHTDSPVDHTPPALSEKTAEELVPLLGHANAWYRETAQRMLVQGEGRTVVEALQAMAMTDENPQARIHALWTLKGINALTPGVLYAAGQTDNQRVRVQVLRLSEFFHSVPETPQLVALMQSYVQEQPDWQLDLQIAFTAGILAGLDTPEAYDVLLGVMERHGDDRLFRQAIISGLRGKEAAMLALVDEGPIVEELTGALLTAIENGGLTLGSLLALVDTPEFAERRNDFLYQIAKLSVGQARLDVIDMLIARMQAPDADVQSQEVILRGIIEGQAGRNSLIQLEGKPAIFDRWAAETPEALADLVPQLDDVFVYERTAVDPELLARMIAGQMHYDSNCATCHGHAGEGIPSVAPPLANSQWVQGHPRMLATLVLNGIEGDIIVGERLYTSPQDTPGVMPGLKTQIEDDQVLADILTFIRGSVRFENEAGAVDPQLVAEERQRTVVRDQPYSVNALISMGNELIEADRQAAIERGEDVGDLPETQELVPIAQEDAGPDTKLARAGWLNHNSRNLVLTLLAVTAPLGLLLIATVVLAAAKPEDLQSEG